MTGEWPDNVIDHINGDGTDNRWSNLREATQAQNVWNAKTPVHNTSGRVGVRYRADRNKWCARIKINGVQFNLGNFNTFEQACEARLSAEITYRGSFRYGNSNGRQDLCYKEQEQ
jgi:hypothetical protein